MNSGPSRDASPPPLTEINCMMELTPVASIVETCNTDPMLNTTPRTTESSLSDNVHATTTPSNTVSSLNEMHAATGSLLNDDDDSTSELMDWQLSHSVDGSLLEVQSSTKKKKKKKNSARKTVIGPSTPPTATADKETETCLPTTASHTPYSELPSELENLASSTADVEETRSVTAGPHRFYRTPPKDKTRPENDNDLATSLSTEPCRTSDDAAKGISKKTSRYKDQVNKKFSSRNNRRKQVIVADLTVDSDSDYDPEKDKNDNSSSNSDGNDSSGSSSSGVL